MFPAELDPPHCSPLAARVAVGACLGGAWHLSADPESSEGEAGWRRAGVGMPIVCVCVCIHSCARDPLGEAPCPAVGAAAAERRRFGSQLPATPCLGDGDWGWGGGGVLVLPETMPVRGGGSTPGINSVFLPWGLEAK